MSTILIVEDDTNVARALAMRLKQDGYTVHVANDAVNAIAKAIKERPDLMILDVSLPGGDGFGIAERLQGVSSTVHIPFLFMTASRRPEFIERARQLGASAFLEKPYDPIDLLAAVRQALGSAPVDAPADPPPSPRVPAAPGPGGAGTG
jgi:DNA-binding response OmpR family regulator